MRIKSAVKERKKNCFLYNSIHTLTSLIKFLTLKRRFILERESWSGKEKLFITICSFFCSRHKRSITVWSSTTRHVRRFHDTCASTASPTGMWGRLVPLLGPAEQQQLRRRRHRRRWHRRRRRQRQILLVRYVQKIFSTF